MQIIKNTNCNVKLAYITINVNMTEEMWRNFGIWLKSERRKTGLTQEKVAEKSEIHVVQISRIENGHSGAKRQTVIDVVEATNKYSETGYKIDVNEALSRAGFASDAPVLPEPIKVSDFDGFDPNDLKDIKEYIKFKKSQKKQ